MTAGKPNPDADLPPEDDAGEDQAQADQPRPPGRMQRQRGDENGSGDELEKPAHRVSEGGERSQRENSAIRCFPNS